jgi:hypothetical protein
LAPHTALLQSLATLHAKPAAQGKQLPPQSVADSSPFRTPSVHVGTRHTPSTQYAVRQSLGVEQALPFAHGAQLLPPQSTSTSSPFCTRSLHVGSAQ